MNLLTRTRAMLMLDHSMVDTQGCLLSLPPLSLSWKSIANKIAIKRGKIGILLTRGTNPCLRGILGADMMSCAGVSSEKCSRASQRFRNCFSAAWELRNSRRHVLFFFFFIEWRKHMQPLSHVKVWEFCWDALCWEKKVVVFFFTQNKEPVDFFF